MKIERIIETKTCKFCNTCFDITDKDIDFYNSISPVFRSFKGDNKGELIKYPIGTPSFCPDCRQQRRLSFRNDRKLYKRKCDATGEERMMMYPPGTPFKVYNSNYWHSDKWDAKEYHKDFDFEKNFFEQFSGLLLEVPRYGRNVRNTLNCDYTNNLHHVKDGYLSFSGGDSEKVYYCKLFKHCFYTVDCRKITNSNNCYECINCDKCYNLKYGENCIDVQDSWYMKNCTSCYYCFACTNLVKKKFCIENKQYREDEYNKILPEYIAKYSRKTFTNFCSKTFTKATYNMSSKNVLGNNIHKSKNVFYSYNIEESEDLKYCYDLRGENKNIMDINEFGWNITNCLDSSMIGHNCSNLLFCNQVFNHSSNLLYCDSCFSCNNCFGCVGLKNKEYCILNKQYTKEKYEKMVPKIILLMYKKNEWGEFFPSEFSPVGYNETLAQEYYPIPEPKEFLKKDIATSGEDKTKGNILKFKYMNYFFNWSKYIEPKRETKKTVEANKLPNDINDIPDDIVNWAIICGVSKRPYRVVAGELEFYRKHNLPIPRKHPRVRHADRMKLKSERNLYDRDCFMCKKSIKTTYPKTSIEKIYCDECYNSEVNKNSLNKEKSKIIKF